MILTSQHFDVALIVDATPGLFVVGGTAKLNGLDVTIPLGNCLIKGSLNGGGKSFRCPNRVGYDFKVGMNDVSISLELSDGTVVSDSVEWNIISNEEI